MDYFDNVFEVVHRFAVVTILVFAVNYLQQIVIVQYSLSNSHGPFVLPSDH